MEKSEAGRRVRARLAFPLLILLILCGFYWKLLFTYHWRATVDGAPAPIQEVDMALRGVLVTQGRHDIQFYYRPWPVYLGALMTLFGVGGAVGLAFVDRRRERAAYGHQ